MKDYFKKCDKKMFSLVKRIGKVADKEGVECFVVGGIVRDLILGRQNKDLDIVVVGDAMKFSYVVAKALNGNCQVYKDFKTATVMLKSGYIIDFATARKERYARPGSLPTVKKGTLKEDLFRRDFTVNTLALSINKNTFGHLVDEFGGLKDLKNKKIRMLHDKSFVDDPTRILRAVRFEQRFSFSMESKTRQLLLDALEKKKEENVKAPRYFEEFKKMLAEEYPIKCIERLKRLNGMGFLFGKRTFDLKFAKKVQGFVLLAKRKQKFEDVNWWLITFMSLMKNVDDFTLNNVLGKFHFRKDEKVGLLYAREVEGIVARLNEKHMCPSQVYEILESLNNDVIVFAYVASNNNIAAKRIEKYLDVYSKIGLKISGNDIKQLGVVSGKKIGEILNTVLFWKIDNKIVLKKDELRLAKQLAAL